MIHDPCRSCGLGPCVCGEFDIPSVQATRTEHCERGSDYPAVARSLSLDPPHASGVAHD